MKMVFALVAAMSGLPGLSAAEWVVSGDWELLVKDGGRALSCNDINHPDPRGLVFFADALIEDIFTAPWR